MAFESLSEKLSAVFKKLKGKGKLNEADVRAAMREVKLALLEADVNFKITKQFVSAVTEKAIGAEVFESLTPAQQVIKIVNDELTALMGQENTKLNFPSKPPCVVMLCGLQGSGKTTHAAKLAKMFREQGKRPLLVACDIYRPAAIDQLKVMGERAGVPVFELGKENPVKIAKKAIAHAKDHGNDMVLLDTAGRLHIDEQLMDELKNIKKETTPDEVLLVVDSMIGQDAVNVAESFNQQMEIDGVILTKLDCDTRGGAALSIRAVTGKPIKFAGVGEKIEEIEPFYPDRMASRILGMGDMLTLIEKAQSQYDSEQANKAMQKLQKNKFDMDDLLAQMKQIKKMGPLKQIMGMMPGVSNKINDDQLDEGEKQLQKIEAIICSMTPQEKSDPKIINPQRKRRIAAGSGTEVPDVNRLLKQFEQLKDMMKRVNKLSKGKRKGGFGLPPGMM